MKKCTIVVLAITLFLFGTVSRGAGQQKAGAPATPQHGGTLRIISPSGPRILGYYPEMGPGDSSAVFPAIERMMDMSSKRDIAPFLAESVDVDRKNLTITFHLRKGIKFHDGSDMDAEAVAWNYRTTLAPGSGVKFADKIKSIETVGNHTVVLHLTEYNNRMLSIYGWIPIFSKVAFETKGKEWCRTNPVGTGPFKLVEWKRDVSLKWERFKDYWQKGLPYLDAIEVRYIPDAVTASTMFQAKEADVWIAPPGKDQADLTKKGYRRQASWPALPIILYLNTANAKAPTANVKVREAIEYGLDRPAMVKALGFGYAVPLKTIAPETEWGYDPTYTGRSYYPAKARALLVDAGYPNGLRLKVLCPAESSGRNATTEAIKAYLDQAGFNIDVDVADTGRFFNNVWVKGWDDMALFFMGLDENFLASIEGWLGHSPRTKLASQKQPPEFLALSEKALTYFNVADQKAATEKMVRMVADQALVIPLYYVPFAYMTQPWAHVHYLEDGFIRWRTYDDWVEKH